MSAVDAEEGGCAGNFVIEVGEIIRIHLECFHGGS
jgi:hypothetical protein